MKKRLKRIAIGSFYGSLTLAIIAVTVLLVTIGRGYFFDFKTGQLSGGGLVLIDSRPSNAAIYLDGKDLGKTTSSRLPLKDGRYDLRLERDGFRSWQKNLEVVTSEVTWAKYPLLIPNRLEPQSLFNLEPPLLTKQSDDSKFLALAAGGSRSNLQVLEAGSLEPRTIYTLSAAQRQAGFKFDSIQWSQDNEHMLLGLRSPKARNFVVLSAVNTQDTVNISNDFSLPLNNLQFSAQNWREIYWQSAEGLRKLDLANRTVSAILAEPVDSYRVSDEAVFFIRQGKRTAELVRLERDNQLTVLASDLPRDNYRLDFAEFDDKRYVVLLNRDSQQVWLYPDPSAPNHELRKFENIRATNIHLAPDDRYLVMQNGKDFATFDLEFDKLHRFSLPAEVPSELSWFDPYHLLMVSGDKVQIFEFDGGNLETIHASRNGYPAYGVRSEDLIYSFVRTADGKKLSLQATDLTP